MVSSVTFGKIYNVGDKTVVGGGQSGIDSEALITGLTAAKRLPAVALETKQKKNTEINTAFGELQTMLKNFQSSADLLRKTPTVGTQDGNVFQYRTSSVSTNDGSSGATYVSATVASGASVQSYTINEITQLAKAKKQQTNAFTIASPSVAVVSATPGANQFGVGNLTIKGKTISLADGDTLQNVSDKFNAISTDTGIRSSILQTSPGNYTLIFTATQTGLTSDFDLSNPSTVTDSGGVLTNISFMNTQLAQNAQFKIDDTVIIRETNQITDLIPDVTLNLKQVTPSGTEIDFDVVPDTDTLKTALTNFVDAYNNLRVFMSKQTETDADGTYKDTAVLGNNQAMRSVINNLTSELAGSALGLGSDVFNKLSDIGITFIDFEGDAESPKTRNVLSIDTAKLQSALVSNYDQVKNMFEFNVTSDVPDFQVFNRTNGLGVSEFTLNLDPTTSTYTATYTLNGNTNTINLTATAVNGGGYSLAAPDGSPLAGLQMIFTGTTASTGNVKITQGLGDRIYNALNDATKASGGTITSEVESLKTKSDRMAEEIAKIDEIVERYRDSLVTRFSKLESALASINTILQSLDAQAQARNNQ